MKPSEINRLRRRWTDAVFLDLQRQLLEQSRVVRGPHSLNVPWDEAGGDGLDLRGADARRRTLNFSYLTLHGADLSFARGDLIVLESELFDCRFDSVKLATQAEFGRRFERCSFRGASFMNARIGSQVSDCSFEDAKLRRLRAAPNTVFERCSFDRTDLSAARLEGVSFVDCTFEDAVFSATTTFQRCSFVRTSVDAGPAQVTSSSQDGSPLPDRWAGEPEAQAAEQRYVRRYLKAVEEGEEDTMPLDPDDE